jgi:uncharacterized membrane protein
MQKAKAVDWYAVFFTFLCFCFIGWVIETSFMFLMDGHFVARGLFMLNGGWFGLPLITIYGFGGLLIIILFEKMRSHPIKLFLFGMISMTAFELAVSYLCDLLYGGPLWDYGDFLNFEGRISVASSIVWGLLTVFVVRKIYPFIRKLYRKIARLKYHKIVLWLLIIATVISAAFRGHLIF